VTRPDDPRPPADPELERLLRDVERIVDGLEGIARLVIEGPIRQGAPRDER
jgi:hypothetical protein